MVANIQLRSQAEAVQLEASVHRKLESQQIIGEWFHIDAQSAIGVIDDVMKEFRIDPKEEKDLFNK